MDKDELNKMVADAVASAIASQKNSKDDSEKHNLDYEKKYQEQGAELEKWKKAAADSKAKLDELKNASDSTPSSKPQKNKDDDWSDALDK